MSKGIIEYINNTQRPLIGLEYIAILVDNDDTHFKEFRCLACHMNAKALLARHIIKHVESVQHQLKYLVSVSFVRPNNCSILFFFIQLSKYHAFWFVFPFWQHSRFYIFHRFLVNYIEVVRPPNIEQFLFTLFVMPSNVNMDESNHNVYQQKHIIMHIVYNWHISMRIWEPILWMYYENADTIVISLFDFICWRTNHWIFFFILFFLYAAAELTGIAIVKLHAAAINRRRANWCTINICAPIILTMNENVIFCHYFHQS